MTAAQTIGFVTGVFVGLLPFINLYLIFKLIERIERLEKK